MAKFPKTLLLVSSVKIQYARDDEGPHSCINHNKNIDNDLYCSSNEFPNHLALLTMPRDRVRRSTFNMTYSITSYKRKEIDPAYITSSRMTLTTLATIK